MSWASHVRRRADKLCSVRWANEMGCLQAQNGSGICAVEIQIFLPLKASIFFFFYGALFTPKVQACIARASASSISLCTKFTFM